MNEFQPGDRILIRARVQQAPKSDRDAAYQTYSLILPDGQNLQTNVKNLEAAEKVEQADAADAPSPMKAKALTQPPAHKAMPGPKERL